MSVAQVEVLNLESRAKQVLQETFGYQQFRSGQEEIINTVLSGRDCLVVMSTGGRRSLYYQIPVLLLNNLTMVVSLLISLMKDRVDQLQTSGVAATCLNSTQTHERQLEVMTDRRTRQARLFYIASEHLMLDNFLEYLAYWSPMLLVVDEARCISQQGHDLHLEYATLGQSCQRFPTLSLMVLTTTTDDTTRQDIVRLLGLNDPLIQISSFDRPNICYILMEEFKPLNQLTHYVQEQRGKSDIIYCDSRVRVEDIAARLQGKRISAVAHHAGLENNVRADVQEKFQRDDLQIVVTTVAFGMGINKPNVRLVVHFDTPRNIESYYQETGYAGRDGLPAEVMLLYDPTDMAWLCRCLEEKLQEQLQGIERHKLNAIGTFAEVQACRRLVLLNYFGEGRQGPCGNRDICPDLSKQYDGSTGVQIALSIIGRVNQRFGMGYVVEVIHGTNNQRIRDYGRDKLKIYGMGRDKSHEHWVSVIRQLIHLGLVTQSIAQHSTPQLTEAAHPVLRGESSLQLAVPRIVTFRPKTMQKSLDGNCDHKPFVKLRKLRKSIADESNAPPYVVFNDATLIETAEQVSVTTSEMFSVSGVGTCKLECSDKPFMTLTHAYVDGDDEEQSAA